ncbi:DMT family transporter [Amaricoccus macauensis]|uniref:DMT family transporter n=1 Tax=Amaricoccus macauensis TaxID=57001 RepID=UPI003C7C0857
MRVYAIFVFLGVIWGSNFIYMKWAVAIISPAQVTFLRVLLGFLPLAFVAWRQGVIRRDQLRLLPHFAAMAMLATAFYYFAFAQGLALLPSGVAGVLTGSIALFTFLCALIFLPGERGGALSFLGVALGLAGVVLVARPWESAGAALDPVGILWMMLGALSIGLSFVYARRFLSPYKLPPLALATWQTGIATVVLFAFTDLSGIGAITSDWNAAIGMVIGLGALGTGLAYLIYYYLLQELGAVAASGSTYLPPVVALLIGWLAGERVGLPEIAAITLILSGVAVLQVGQRRKAGARTVTPLGKAAPGQACRA